MGAADPTDGIAMVRTVSKEHCRGCRGRCGGPGAGAVRWPGCAVAGAAGGPGEKAGEPVAGSAGRGGPVAWITHSDCGAPMCDPASNPLADPAGHRPGGTEL